MEKVLIAGDTHGNAGHVQALLATAVREGCRRLVVVGDFGAWEHIPEGRRFFDVVGRSGRKHDVVVYFLDGNHDKSSLVHELYSGDRDDEGFLVCRTFLRYIPRGHRWTWSGTRFAAFGGAYSVDKAWRVAAELGREQKAANRRQRYGSSRIPAARGSLWFPEEEMTDAEVAGLLAADPSPADVVLSHDKPRASQPSWNRKDLPECWPNQDRIQRVAETLRPRLLVHGHLHFRYTDEISVGADARPVRVEGLAADPSAGTKGGKKYDRAEAWMVLELPLGGAPD